MFINVTEEHIVPCAVRPRAEAARGYFLHHLDPSLGFAGDAANDRSRGDAPGVKMLHKSFCILCRDGYQEPSGGLGVE